tara:strand:- start:42153 stop:42290 length:138 start_codon:yes stop_codon:yes gene_type:complete
MVILVRVRTGYIADLAMVTLINDPVLVFGADLLYVPISISIQNGK